MPHNFILAGPTDFEGWRGAARRFVLADVPPEEVIWSLPNTPDLFGGDADPPEARAAVLNVPRRFVELAKSGLLHSDPERFALFYRLLFRLKREPQLLDVSVDPDVARAHLLAKNVGRDIHKMHAFVRFREVASEEGARFVAWFEPEHHTIEAGAPFFARRFSNMHWSILSPEVSAHFDGELTFGPGAGRHDAPDDDALEEMWRGYYAAIFNPARLKVTAMKSEMPRKYWKNLPEASLIAPLIADARKRTDHMVSHGKTEPKPNRQREIVPVAIVRSGSNDPLDAVREAARHCRNCPLWEPATQTVFGEGPPDAPLLFLGEQPGDKEDLAGRPFVGPAGQLFDRAMAEAEVDRAKAYVTNAVKHFKFTPRGKIRLHQKPGTPEIRACKPWLEKELAIVRPGLVIAMGATAVQSLFGKAMPIGANRGRILEAPGGQAALITVHPSFLLRVPDAARKAEKYAHFVEDLRLTKPYADAA
ncbi:UdgX family uracil-DNA binding protein [Terrihabitans sp. B22-R8]|uniref:UdgX family uracil-DNA binding protein n=1 Tax=Terrihabitans sp. B22-R8 TaxID=3425128 RepID=UPI00403CDCE7